MLYYNWQKHPSPPGAPYNKKSPNLVLLLGYLVMFFGGLNLGLYVVRVVTGGFRWSTHAYGAALDWGYRQDREMALRVIDFLIANHEKLGVQMIVDEAYHRTWKCWRDELNGPGWKNGLVTGGGNWLHIETTPAAWSDSTPIADRLTPTPALPIPVPPTPPITEENIMRLIQPEGDIAVLIQDGLTCSWAESGDVAGALVAAGLVPAEVTVVKRVGLKGLVLVGPAPTDAAYAGARPDRPGRTVPSDFAAHRPNG